MHPIHLALPLGTQHGWGVAGRMIAVHLARLAPVRLHTQAFHPSFFADEMEQREIQSLLPPGTDPLNPAPAGPVPGPVLRGIPSLNEQFYPELRGPFTAGYTFFEDNLAVTRDHPILSAFDHLVAGSTWCADVLRAAGFPLVSTILQGINPRFFNPVHHEKELLRDHFVIFSGGKLELRKGQDLVIRAVAILQQRHKDVLLVNSWYNPWPHTMNTIGASRHIRVPSVTGTYHEIIGAVLAANGVDLNRTITLDPRPNPLMAQVYKNTDVGLFPNRCEGGTNLVMCEYMACRKPVIAARHTGHADILTDANSLPLDTFTPMDVANDDSPTLTATWYDADLDEIVARLEYAHQHRDRLAPLAARAAADLAPLTWSATAAQFHALLTSPLSR